MRDQIQAIGILILGLTVGQTLHAQAPAKDKHGVLLPAGAVARFGTSAFHHTQEIVAFTFSADKKLLATVSVHSGEDYVVTIWDIADRQPRKQFKFKRPDWPLTGLQFSPDGALLAFVATSVHHQYPGLPKEGQLWDWEAGARVEVNAKGKVRTIAFAPDRPLVALLSDNEDHIILWNLQTKKEESRLPVQRESVLQMIFDIKGKVLTASHNDGKLRAWDLETSKEIPLKQHYRNVAEMSSDGAWIAAHDSEKGWGLYETATGKRRFDVGQTITTLGFGDDNRSVAWIKDHEIHVWDIPVGKEKTRVPITEHSQPKFRLSQDGKFLGVCHGHQVRLYDLTLPASERERGWNDQTVSMLVFSPDGKLLANSTWNHVALWRVADAAPLRLPKRYSDMGMLRFSADSKELLVGSEGRVQSVEDCRTFKVRQEQNPKPFRDPNRFHGLTAHDGLDGLGRAGGWPRIKTKVTVSTVIDGKMRTVTIDGHFAVASPDGRTLMSAQGVVGPDIMNSPPPIYASGTWMVWDAVTGRKRFDLVDHSIAPTAKKADRETELLYYFGRRGSFGPPTAACSPNCRHIAWYNDGRLVVSDLYSGTTIASIVASSSVAAFAPDGKSLACVGADHKIQLLEVATGKPRVQFAGHAEPVTCLRFSPDGSFLASGSADTSILLWDAFGKQRAKTKLRLSDANLRDAWSAFAKVDVAKAHDAAIELSQHAEQAIPWLRDQIEANAKTIDRDIEPLIRALNSNQYRVRQQAERKLRQHGALVISALEAALKNPPSLEYRRRIESLMLDVSGTPAGGTWLQTHRGLELLERMRAADALESLGQGDGPIGLEAKTCRERLKKDM